ncbi:MAG: ISL3 family transposase [Acidimicrobiales bacterium]
MCEVLVGLPDVKVLGVIDQLEGPLIVRVETRGLTPRCAGCGRPADLKDRDEVTHVDLPVFGRQAKLAWVKRRWRCLHGDCAVGSWTETSDEIALGDRFVTTRAARWMTLQVGGHGRTVDEVAADLGCDWHTVNDTVVEWGEALLAVDDDRVADVEGLGLDETLFNRTGRWRTQAWCTSIVDVGRGQLLDVVEGRSAAGPAGWLAQRPAEWLAAIDYGVLDLSGPYRATFDTMLPDAAQVADPFHVVKLANSRVDEVRRRVQNETLGHRGRKDDPLYRVRRLLTKADERLDDRGRSKLVGLLDAGDPRGEVRMAWHAKEVVRSIYEIDDHELAVDFVDRLAIDLQDESVPPEINQLGRTVARWATQITNWHRSGLSNGPTEAINNLIKRIKRIGFGFRKFRNYRIRALLYAGRPNWDLLDTLTPARIR